MDEFQRANPRPDIRLLKDQIEALGRRVASDRGEPYNPAKHHPSWDQITALYEEFDRALADWRRRYLVWQQGHLEWQRLFSRVDRGTRECGP